MRRIVRDRVLVSFEHTKLSLAEFLSEHLRYPEDFPYTFSRPLVSFREVRRLRIIPLLQADYPPLEIDALIKVWVASRVSHLHDRLRPGVLDIDVQVIARGTVRGDGTYDIAPQSAMLKAWY